MRPHLLDRMGKIAILLMLIAILGSTTAQNEGEVRLVGGVTASEGRVEIYHNGEWGTVCDDRWDIDDAAVVCRQLGYQEAWAAQVGAHFGGGNDTQRTWMDEVVCSGSESQLSDCEFLGWFGEDCSHLEDAGVTCGNPVSEGYVRLSGGSRPREGRVEVFFGGQWGTVCGDVFWSNVDADVVCRQLGFDEGRTSFVDYGSSQGLPILLTSVNCVGFENRLTECPNNAAFINCPFNTAAGVRCYGGLYGNEGNIRLVDGYSSSEGRVEIYYNYEWGTVCNDEWELSDAQVVCRQLGFADVVDYDHDFASGVGAIHLDDVDCQGSESSLADCSHRRWGDNDCSHSEDIGVKCSTTLLASSGLEAWLIAIIVIIVLLVVLTFVVIIVVVSAKKKQTASGNPVSPFTVSGGNYPSAAGNTAQGAGAYPMQPAPVSFYPPPPSYSNVMAPVSSPHPSGVQNVPVVPYASYTNPSQAVPSSGGSAVTGLPAQPPSTAIAEPERDKPTI